MSIVSLIATTLIVGAEPTEAPLQELVQLWNTECASQTTNIECGSLAAEIELGLYDLLRKMTLNRVEIDRELMRAAADADLPALAKLGVGLLGEPKSPEEVEVLLRAVDHPVLAVRYIAARNLGVAQNPQWKAMEPYWTGWTLAPSANGPQESLIPDSRPEPDAFAMQSFNGLTFHYYGSDRQSAMFTTSEAAESLVKRFGANKRVLNSIDAMQQQIESLQPEMDRLQKEMEAAGEANDVDRLTETMKKYQAVAEKMGKVSGGAAYNPAAPAQTVILTRDPTTQRATCTVQIQRDPALNRTVLVFWREGGWRS